MFRVRTYNQISVKGLDRFDRQCYEVGGDIAPPDAILLRSHKLQPEEILDSVRIIGRAGAGVNNIPLDYCTERGVVVCNSPGANANAVKELVACGMLLASRDIVPGIGFVNGLAADMDPAAMGQLLEKEKKRFAGSELRGKTLGVVGLGAIGSLVARLGLNLGMDVVGYDPALSVEAAWRLPSDVTRMENIQALFARADFITLHLPVLDSTRHLVNAESIVYMKPDVCLLNFAREEIVDTLAVIDALDAGKIRRFVTDFPHPGLLNRADVIPMPHIGASTEEAEENCAMMAADQIKGFLDHGNIRNSVNFPAIELERTSESRLAITNRNAPGMLSNILAILGQHNINVVDLLNKSRNDIAYNLIDIEGQLDDGLWSELAALDGVVNVRHIEPPRC
jgi:D-3-phosphoglycerate dehydrogenase